MGYRRYPAGGPVNQWAGCRRPTAPIWLLFLIDARKGAYRADHPSLLPGFATGITARGGSR